MRSLHAASSSGRQQRRWRSHIGGCEVRAFWPRLKRDPPLFAADGGKNGVEKKEYKTWKEEKKILFSFVHIIITYTLGYAASALCTGAQCTHNTRVRATRHTPERAKCILTVQCEEVGQKNLWKNLEKSSSALSSRQKP
ncbi:hypothetical protein ACI65C_004199 [Semiaphis heraclei]